MEVLLPLHCLPWIGGKAQFFPALPSLVLRSEGPVHLLPFELERDTPVSGALGPKALATQPARHTQDIRSKRLTAAIKWHFYTCLNWSEDENLETM